MKWKDKLCELFCGPTLNYDRNDNKHDRKNNNHNNDIDSYETNHDYNNNYNNDNKSSEIETKDKGTSLKCWRFISNASYQLCISSDHE